MKQLLICLLVGSSTFAASLFIPYFGVATTGNHLLPDLIAQYKFDEASGNAIDNETGHDLTLVGTSASGVGKISGARTLSATNGNYFYHTDHIDFEPGAGSYTIAFWIKLGVTPTPGPTPEYQMLLTKWNIASNTGSWFINAVGSDNTLGSGHTNGNGFQAIFSGDGVNGVGAGLYALSYATAGEWYFVCVRFDVTALAQILTVYDAAGTKFEDIQILPPTDIIWNGTESIMVGGFSATTTTIEDTDSASTGTLIDELGFWKRALSDCEVAQLAIPVARNGYDSLPCGL